MLCFARFILYMICLAATCATAGTARANVLTNANFASCSGSTHSGWSGSQWSCNYSASAFANLPTGTTTYIGTGFSTTLTQTFSDLVGVSYTLTADIAYSQGNGAIDIDSSPVVTFGNVSDTTSSFWSAYTATFVGTGADSIKLVAGPNGYPGVVGFTDLSITPAPEPASLALFGLGAAAVGMIRRRRA